MKNKLIQRITGTNIFKNNKTFIFRWYIKIRNGLHTIFTLQDGTDAEGTITGIANNVQLRGANIWILICAAGLASIGLDVNSAAVIIGAMLISPLMSPILGIGLAVGINDRRLLIDSLKNFGIAVAASIGASAIYFFFTPLGQATPELIARTSPTLLDVAVALFGGIAGIVAGSRKEKTNAIPGVAIATALMPPLCTAGFGIATANWAFFFGAFYLFFINAVFISLSTYLVVRFLHFPYQAFPDERTKMVTRRWIMGFVLVVMAPSAVILYGVIKDQQQKTAIGNFLKDNLTTAHYEPIQWAKQEEGDSVEYLKVYMVGEPIKQVTIDSLGLTLGNYGLEDYRLKVVQMNIPEEDRERMAQEATKSVLNSIEISQRVRDTKQEEIDSLKNVISAMKADTLPIWNISQELAVLLPEVENLAYAKALQSTTDSGKQIPLFLFDYTRAYGRSRETMVRERLEGFLRQRAGLDTLRLRRLVE